MRTAILGAVLLVLGGIAAATGLLPLSEVAQLAERVWPILLFVLAWHSGLDPLPFALTTVWLANIGSPLFPVSSLRNLFAQHSIGNPSPLEPMALMAARDGRRQMMPRRLSVRRTAAAGRSTTPVAG